MSATINADFTYSMPRVLDMDYNNPTSGSVF